MQESVADMEADELMREYEVEIERPWIKNKMAFLKHGSRGELEAIREIVRFKTPEPNKIDAFIRICESRVDRLNSFSSGLMTFVSVALATFTFSITFLFGTMKEIKTIPKNSLIPVITWYFDSPEYLIWKFIMTILLFLIITCAFQFLRYRAQVNAWYAIKEGLLLEKKDS
ncbi:MAG: hypothetical protein JW878_09465 [Methanomicrobia archaeon]|nr:hypothetical protein [Methanomicrobia archaeon]